MRTRLEKIIGERGQGIVEYSLILALWCSHQEQWQ